MKVFIATVTLTLVSAKPLQNDADNHGNALKVLAENGITFQQLYENQKKVQAKIDAAVDQALDFEKQIEQTARENGINGIDFEKIRNQLAIDHGDKFKKLVNETHHAVHGVVKNREKIASDIEDTIGRLSKS